MVSRLDPHQHRQTKPAKGLKLRKYARKQPWTQREDVTLAELVKTHGVKRWSIISSIITNRSAKQCRERWKHQLDPNINTASWTHDDEWMLYLHHAVIGNKWTYLINFFPGRTDNSIKNHWNTQMRKRMGKYKLRLENAVKLCRVDESLFRKSFAPIECRLIEKISKSLIYKQNQILTVDSENKNSPLDRYASSKTMTTVHFDKNKDCPLDSRLARRNSPHSIFDGEQERKEQTHRNSQTVRNVEAHFRSDEARKEFLPAEPKVLRLVRPEGLGCQVDGPRLSDLGPHTNLHQSNALSSTFPTCLGNGSFVQTMSFNFRVGASSEERGTLSDSEIQKNFSRLREFAAGLDRQCMSS